MASLNRYSNGKIYMIESASAGLIYYGSTCLPLYKRLHGHKNNYKKYQNGKSNFVTSYNILDHEDHKIILVEEYPCDNKYQLQAREAYYIRTRECVNKVMPNRTRKEYREDNKDKIQANNKEWRLENSDKIKEDKKVYYENHKEQISDKFKQYYEDNKQELIKKNKQYWENNEDKIKEHRKQKVECECGSIYSRANKASHYKSIKHQGFVLTLQQ